LIEMGLVAEAHAGDRWGVIERHGRQPGGEPIIYQGRGYASEAWRLASESLTRAAVRQAIGRARANTAAGVPVVAVTTENTGLPVLPAKALPRSKPEIERVVEAIACTHEHTCTTSAKIPINNNRESGTSCSLLAGCSLSSIRERLPKVPRRTLMRWLNTAVESGAVIRTGQTTSTRYTLPAAPQRAKQEPVPPDGTCPSCGSHEHRDSVSSDGQIGRRCCAECGAFITFTIWHGKPVPGRLPPLMSQQHVEPLVISSG
jgi:transcription elongation factor Elf1